MKPSTGKPNKGFTMVPNVVIESKLLNDTDKLVYIVLKSHAYGDKVDVWPSQIRIAEWARKSRSSVRASLRKFTEAGIVTEVERDGRGKATYRLCPEADLVRFCQVPGPVLPGPTPQPGPVLPPSIQHSNTKKENAPPEATSAIEPHVEAGDTYGKTAFGKCSADESGPGHSSSGRVLTKREINEQMLAPNGKRPDVDGLESDLFAVLSIAESPSDFKSRELAKLVSAHGEEYCAFWRAWLLRKIAAEYAAGRPVKNPAGLYRKAVEESWDVDPSWPEFKPLDHTDAAWKEKLGIGNAPFDPVLDEEIDAEIPF